MTLKDKCNLILTRMIINGFDVVENCNDWTLDEMDYFVVNYESYYITNYKQPIHIGG